MLLSKGMSNIYLKVTIEKNWHSHKFDARGLEGNLYVAFIITLKGILTF